MSSTARGTRAFVFFVFLAVLHTWPLASAPHRLSLNHNADAQLNAWIVSWVARALPTKPLQLWQGNIFQPGERALSLSEPLIVPGIAGAPVFWLTGSAVLTFNVLLIADWRSPDGRLTKSCRGGHNRRAQVCWRAH